MSVSLSPCSVPGKRPSFQLAEDEMELGLGIHGEAGAERTKVRAVIAFLILIHSSKVSMQLLPANQVVQRMLEHLTSQEPGYQYFLLKPGQFSVPPPSVTALGC